MMASIAEQAENAAAALLATAAGLSLLQRQEQ